MHKRVEEELKYQVQLERVIATISTKFVNCPAEEIDMAINQALQSIGEFVGADRSYVFLINDDGKTMDNTHEWCAEGIEPEIDRLKGLPVKAFPWWMGKLKRGRNICIPSVADLPPEAGAEKELLEMQSIQSVGVVPITYAGSLVGFLGLDAVREKKQWTPEAVMLLRIAGEVIISALERRRAQEALKATRQYLADIIDSLPDATFVVDNEGRVVFWNRAMEEVTGIKAESILGKGEREYAMAIYGTRRPMLVDLVLASEEPESKEAGYVLLTSCRGGLVAETQVLNLHGREVVLWGKATALYDAAGNPVGAIESIRDITERKRMEMVLRENEARLREITDNMLDMITRTDTNGVILYASPSYKSVLRYEPEDIVGRSAFDFIHPEDVNNAIAAFCTGVNTVLPGKLEYRFRDADGNYRWMEAVGNPLQDDSGRVAGAVFASRDITERRQIRETLAAEKERLAVTLASIGDGVITTDTKGTIVMLNRAGEEITGWTQEEARGRLLVEVIKIIDEKTQESERHPLQRLLKNGKNGKRQDTVTLVARDGSRKIITSSINPITDESGGNIGFVLVFTDVTERKKLEARSVLSQKLEAIGQLAAGIAHEINTPMQYIGDNVRFLQQAFEDIREYLNSCQKFLAKAEQGTISADLINQVTQTSDALEVDYLLDEIPEAIEQSLDGIERVNKLILAMKDFSHPRIKDRAWADINRGIEGTVTISRNEWKYVADLTTDLDPQLPLVYCVADEINQVILNMIINASHAIKEAIDRGLCARGKITISTRAEGRFIKIVISDTGIGIPRTIIHRIYDPFFTTKEVGKGTGQGLAIAHDIIVNKHNGSIEASSDGKRGTTFTIYLPVGHLSE